MIKNIQKEICTVKLHQQGMLIEKLTCGFNQPVDNSEALGTPGFIKRGLKDIRANQHSRKPSLEAPPTETDSDINSRPFSRVVSRSEHRLLKRKETSPLNDQPVQKN